MQGPLSLIYVQYISLLLCVSLFINADASTEFTECDPSIVDDIYMLLEPGEAITDIHKIDGGFANHLWLIETLNGKYVLRSPREKETNDLFMHSLEISQKAFEHGLAPRVIGVNIDKQQMLLDYAVNEAWPTYHENALPYCETMRTLRSFHKCVVPNVSARQVKIPFSSIFEDRERLFSNLLLPVHFSVAKQRCLRIYECLEASTAHPPVLCHGDFHKGNVLLKQENEKLLPVLIDFDTSAWGHPFFDVVKFTVALDVDSRLEMLKKYLGCELSTLDKAHFELLDLSLLMLVALVRYNYVLDRAVLSDDCLSREEMEMLLDSQEELPSFKSIPFDYQSVKMRQLGAVYALGEFLRRTEGEAFEALLRDAQEVY
jgi:aminoglycoside phosphotransferase (APT) family kinase protein